MKLYKLLDFFEFLSLLAVLIASTLAIGSLIVLGQSDLTVILFIFGGVYLSILLKTKKLAKLSNQRLNYFSSSFHRLTHLLRDEYFRLGASFQKNEINEKCITNNLRNTSEKAINYLAESLSASTGHSISTCIKYFCVQDSVGKLEDRTKNDKNEVPANFTVKTLCRSANSDPSRFDSDRYALTTENTALNKILNDGCDSFFSTDLFKLSESSQKEYVNSNRDWKKYYRSTIIVPIRIKCNLIDNTISDNSYNLLGFLCADSTSIESFQDNEIFYYIDLMKSYADALYPFFDRALFLLDKTGKNVQC